MSSVTSKRRFRVLKSAPFGAYPRNPNPQTLSKRTLPNSIRYSSVLSTIAQVNTFVSSSKPSSRMLLLPRMLCMRQYIPLEQPHTDYASAGPVDASSSTLLVAGYSVSLSTAPCVSVRLARRRLEITYKGEPPFFKYPPISHQVSALSGAVDNGPSAKRHP